METTKRENDQVIRCVDCASHFILTASERKFYLDRGLNFPKRCKECRQRRRQGGKSG